MSVSDPSTKLLGGAALAILIGSLAASPAWAGTTGKLTGLVTDAAKQPLAGVNVTIPTARLGAATGNDGRYVILDVPAGTHTVKVSLIGYGAVTLTGVAIPADRTTDLPVTLRESAVEMKEVVVRAERPLVELGLTSNIATVTRGEIAKLPVQDLEDIVNLQAGVVDGHFRGGRKGEVQYQVDGVTVNNPYDNTSTVRLDRSVLEEVQVISGTFDAEYGQAMSGVVNAVLRRGTNQFEASWEAFAGGFAYPGDRPVESRFEPGSIQNYQLTLSGPYGTPSTLYLVSGRYYAAEDYVFGERRFLPTDRSDFENKVFRGTGDHMEAPLGYSYEWLGLLKVSNRSLSTAEVSYQAIFNLINARKSDWAFRFNPEGLSKQRTSSLVHGLEWLQRFGTTSVLKLNLRQNRFDYQDHVYDDVLDPRYAAAGPPRNDPAYELEAMVQGVENTRFIQTTNAYVIGGALTHHFTTDHHFKAGVEWQPSQVTFGSPGHLAITGDAFTVHVNESPDYPAPQEYKPVLGTVYAQDDLEWNDLRFRGGLRFEYFNPKAYVPSDPANPANTITGSPPSSPQPATRKLSLAPRLGVSFPVTHTSSLFFAYGHFFQMPPLGDIFRNADYGVLHNLQADGVDFGVLGNPDVEPEHTIQYQFGYKQMIGDFLGLDVTTFYKDIRHLLGIEILTTYNNAEYRRLSNADFGSVIGFTLSLDQRTVGLWSSSIDYTWQVAKGNSSDPYEAAQRQDAGEDPRPRQMPLNWDQRHTLNLTVGLGRPREFNVSVVMRAVSGQPYTPQIEAGFGGGLETNSGRKPAAMVLDMRAEKQWQDGRWSVFGRALNALDSRFSNGFVFNNSGSPYYSRTQTFNDEKQLSDPTRLYGPRRIEVGVAWNGGVNP